MRKKVSNNDQHTTNKGLGSQIKAGTWTCAKSRGSVRSHEVIAYLSHFNPVKGSNWTKQADKKEEI